MADRRSCIRGAALFALAGAALIGSAWLPRVTWGAPALSAPATQTATSVGAGDYFFSAPDTIEGGLVDIAFNNAGNESHHAQLVRLPDDLSYDQFTLALAGDERAGLGLVKQVGGAAAVSPGRSSEVWVDLPTGLYAFICVIPTPSDGIRHFAKGMVRPLVVTEPATVAAPPEASGTITLHDFTIDMPDAIPAGRSIYRVANEGPGQPHEVAFVKIAPGKTADDVRQAIMAPAGPPPFQAVGGFQSIDVGGTGYVAVDLEPGDYAAICRVTDPMSGVSHVHLGMIKGFHVG